MKTGKINYVAVGGFVIATLVGLVVSVALLTGRTGATDPYYAIYENVTGVKFGTQVLYEGYPIGQVETVTPTPAGGRMMFRVDFEIKQGWRIPADSIAQIAAPGLLSAITISISAGGSIETLEPGSRVNGREAANIFAVMSSVAGDISELAETRVKPLLASLDRTVKVFGDLMEGEADVLIRGINELAMDVAERLPRIADNVEEFTESMNDSSRQLELILKPENREKIETMIANMDTAAGNFVRLSGDLQKTRDKLDELLAVSNTMISINSKAVENSINDLSHVVDSMARHVDSMNQNLEGAARNMYEFSRQIRLNPGLLLGGTPPRDEDSGR
ncbi:MAG: MlaD family protein [Rhodospirillales bacterium]